MPHGETKVDKNKTAVVIHISDPEILRKVMQVGLDKAFDNLETGIDAVLEDAELKELSAIYLTLWPDGKGAF